MKKRFLSLVCALALIAGLALPAGAAETPGIQVQLDGQNLTFTDAVPTAKEGRTYLPARVVLEALGATVTSDSAAGTVTAVRDGRTLIMTIGSTTATVTENGLSTPITMDAAPYVENDRTYVPVRFAAQAFNCAVGWDGAKQTVVLADSGKLIQDALAGHSYTWQEKLSAYGTKFNSGKWSMDGTVNMDATYGKLELMTADVAVKGLMADAAKLQMDADMKLDMSGLNTLMASMDPNAAAVDPADMKANAKVDIRGDLSAGKLYYQISGIPEAIPGLPDNAWLLFDINDLYRQIGLDIDFTALLAEAKQDSQKQMMTAMIPSVLISVPMDDSVNAYADLSAAAKELAAAFSDESFKKVSGGYTNDFSFTRSGVTVSLKQDLKTNSKGDLTGYQQDISVSADLKSMMSGNEDFLASLNQMAILGITMDALTLSMKTGINDSGSSTANVSVSLGNVFTANVNADLKVASTSDSPDVTPPAGAAIVNLKDLMNSAKK